MAMLPAGYADDRNLALRKFLDFLETQPSVFTRLAHVVATRSTAGDSAGEYRLPGVDHGSAAEVSAFLTRVHRDLFLEWTGKAEPFHIADLSVHFRRLGWLGQQSLSNLQNMQKMHPFVPSGVPESLRDLFLVNLHQTLPLVAARLEYPKRQTPLVFRMGAPE